MGALLFGADASDSPCPTWGTEVGECGVVIILLDPGPIIHEP